MCALRDFGRSEGGSDHYQSVGWNLKFTDLQAVVGLSQMSRIAEIVAKKKTLFELYRECLSGIEEIEVPETNIANVTPWFVDVLVNEDCKRPLMKHLRDNGVGSREFYPALHAEPAFSYPGSFPVAAEVSSRGFWLPSSLRVEEKEVIRICDLIRQFFA